MKKNKIIMGAVGMAMMACPAVPVYASESEPVAVASVPILTQSQSKNVNNSDKGSITIQLEKSETAADLSSVKFGITKVADLVNGEYVLSESFKDSDVDLNNIENAEELQKVATKLSKTVKTHEYEAMTGKDGTATVSELDTGVYLMVVTDNAQYDIVMPTLVSIPTYQDIVGYNYDITVEPKHSAKTPDDEDKKEDKKNEEQPDTGVNSHMNEYLAGAGISMACIAGIILFKKKKKDKDEDTSC